MRQIKTVDGHKLTSIIKLAKSLGAGVREGKNHKMVITYPGIIPCALGETTDFKKHVKPGCAKHFQAIITPKYIKN